jgi:hypothetical protein
MVQKLTDPLSSIYLQVGSDAKPVYVHYQERACFQTHKRGFLNCQ